MDDHQFCSRCFTSRVLSVKRHRKRPNVCVVRVHDSLQSFTGEWSDVGRLWQNASGTDRSTLCVTIMTADCVISPSNSSNDAATAEFSPFELFHTVDVAADTALAHADAARSSRTIGGKRRVCVRKVGELVSFGLAVSHTCDGTTVQRVKCVSEPLMNALSPPTRLLSQHPPVLRLLMHQCAVRLFHWCSVATCADKADKCGVFVLTKAPESPLKEVSHVEARTRGLHLAYSAHNRCDAKRTRRFVQMHARSLLEMYTCTFGGADILSHICLSVVRDNDDKLFCDRITLTCHSDQDLVLSWAATADACRLYGVATHQQVDQRCIAEVLDELGDRSGDRSASGSAIATEKPMRRQRSHRQRANSHREANDHHAPSRSQFGYAQTQGRQSRQYDAEPAASSRAKDSARHKLCHRESLCDIFKLSIAHRSYRKRKMPAASGTEAVANVDKCKYNFCNQQLYCQISALCDKSDVAVYNDGDTNEQENQFLGIYEPPVSDVMALEMAKRLQQCSDKLCEPVPQRSGTLGGGTFAHMAAQAAQRAADGLAIEFDNCETIFVVPCLHFLLKK